MKNIHIQPNKDQTVALCLDTIKKDKQALVFCASKRAAESQAEKTSKQSYLNTTILYNLSQDILLALSNPTKQCKRLAECVKKGVAFHHAGLNSKQRELIEDNFRSGVIKIICSTPTLAAGLDLPAFRAIVRDHKRFGQRGMAPIPVLEYNQMIGRAGRPGQEDYGEGILVANKPEDVKILREQYIYGEIEDIYSKLAVEPVLRTYILSLVSTKLVGNVGELYEFFDNTFYAHQFKDSDKLHLTLRRMVRLLQEWKFLKKSEKDVKEENENLFQTATSYFKNKKNKVNTDNALIATELGKRVSEMYVDPLTAHVFVKAIKKLESGLHTEEYAFMISHLVCCSLELRPLLRVKVATQDIAQSLLEEETIVSEDNFNEYSSDEFADTLLTAQFFMDWMNEFTEDKLMDKYDIRPGEISFKQQHADWLLYVCEELARITKQQENIKHIKKVRVRIKNGVKAELTSLLRFKGIGRVRARTLFNKGIKTTKEVVEIPFGDLVEMIGVKMARNIKEEVGETVTDRDVGNIVERARRIHNKQTSLGDY